MSAARRVNLPFHERASCVSQGCLSRSLGTVSLPELSFFPSSQKAAFPIARVWKLRQQVTPEVGSCSRSATFLCQLLPRAGGTAGPWPRAGGLCRAAEQRDSLAGSALPPQLPSNAGETPVFTLGSPCQPRAAHRYSRRNGGSLGHSWPDPLNRDGECWLLG